MRIIGREATRRQAPAAALLSVALLVGCEDNLISPQERVSGEFELVSYAGMGVPSTTFLTPEVRIVIQSARLLLDIGGTYLIARVYYLIALDDGSIVVQRNPPREGMWTFDGDVVTLNEPDGDRHFLTVSSDHALLSGSIDGIELVFMRARP